MTALAPLARRELSSLFLSPALHLVTFFVVMLYGFIFVQAPLQEEQASFS